MKEVRGRITLLLMQFNRTLPTTLSGVFTCRKHVPPRTQTHTHTHMHAYVCTHIHTYTYTYTHTNIHIHTRICTLKQNIRGKYVMLKSCKH